MNFLDGKELNDILGGSMLARVFLNYSVDI